MTRAVATPMALLLATCALACAGADEQPSNAADSGSQGGQGGSEVEPSRAIRNESEASSPDPSSSVGRGPDRSEPAEAQEAGPPADASSAPVEGSRPNEGGSVAPDVGAGLALWLSAGSGVEQSQGRIVSWKDQSKAARSAKAEGGPTLVEGVLNHRPVVRLDGSDDAFRLAVPVNGHSEITIVTLSSAQAQAPGKEWCCRADETGCSGTYWVLLSWKATADWAGVTFAPKQHEVSLRFGNGIKFYSPQDFYDNQVFGSGGYGTCRSDAPRDPSIAWVRPDAIGAQFSLSIAIKQELEVNLFVDGKPVWKRTMPGGKAPILQDGHADELVIGGGLFNKFFEGDVAEILVYERAITNSEREALESQLRAQYSL